MVNSNFHFLDLNLTIDSEGTIHTSIFVKPTDKGVYTNFNSHQPLQYKKSVISSLVIRALKFSSTPEARTAEIRRLKQVFANNGYPQKMIENIISDKMRKYMSPAPEPNSDDCTFFLAIQNLSAFKRGTKEIKGIVHSHVKSCLPDKEVHVITYFRPSKLSSRFSTRRRSSDAEKSGVVYSFHCSETACNAVYVGHTTQSLRNRALQHRRPESSIYRHFQNDHDKLVPDIDTFLPCFSISYMSSEQIRIKIVEALKIKDERPYINIQYDSSNTLLKLF